MNTVELRIAITKSGKTNRELAGQLGISEQAFYNKINGCSEFKNSEIKCLAKTLDLSREDVDLIFLDSK